MHKNSYAPTLYILAGPNGAGKSTLYEQRIKKEIPAVEFINADLLAKAHFGHNAVTHAESEKGQKLANARRDLLLAQGKDLVTESTFSHHSKLELIKQAQALYYRVIVHHVNVRSADESVKRVAERVLNGGHPVPADKIRERYVRNQSLIKQAVKMADAAVIWDNSQIGKDASHTVLFSRGIVTKVAPNVPKWARELYAEELERFSPTRLNAGAESFVEAQKIAYKLEPKALLHISRVGVYRGAVVGESSLHIIQKLTRSNRKSFEAGSYVAHFKKSLERVPALGESVHIEHIADRKKARVTHEDLVVALAVAHRLAGHKAQIEAATPKGAYAGVIVGETRDHVLQGGKTIDSFLVHDKRFLSRSPTVGTAVTIDYGNNVRRSKASVIDIISAPRKQIDIER